MEKNYFDLASSTGSSAEARLRLLARLARKTERFHWRILAADLALPLKAPPIVCTVAGTGFIARVTSTK
jgi:hypothetical protein